MSRPDGNYWCRTEDFGWEICLYEKGHFVTHGYGWKEDSDFDEIDERQIVRTEPNIIKKAFEAGTNYATYNGRPGFTDAPNFEEWHKRWKVDDSEEKIKFGLFGNPTDHEPEHYD